MNESQDRSTRSCTGVIHERFETTRGKDGRASVDAFRTAICKRKEVSKLWIRTRQKDENRVRPRCMHVHSLWRRGESEPGLYMYPASVKPIVGDVRSLYPVELEGDVLQDHDGLVFRVGTQPSNVEFVVGTRTSRSILQRHEGLVCWHTVEVVTGRKRVVVMPRDWSCGAEDEDLEWEALEALCRREGGYSTVLGPGEAITSWTDAPQAVYHEEPTLSLSFVWLKEEDLLRSLTQTFLIELGQKTAKWVEPQLEDLVQSGLVRAASRFQSEDTWLGKKVILDEVFALYCVIQECRSQKSVLGPGTLKRLLRSLRKEFFRQL